MIFILELENTAIGKNLLWSLILGGRQVKFGVP